MTTFLNFWGAACEISCYITCLSKRWNTPFFSHFKANPTLASFVLGKIKQKLQMIRQQCLPLPKNLVHLGEEDSAITGTSTLAVPQTSLSSLLALQCPDSPQLLEFFCKQNQPDYKNETCDLLWWSGQKRWFYIAAQGSAAIFSCWCFQLLLSSVAIPEDALVSKSKLCFSSGLECPSRGW